MPQFLRCTAILILLLMGAVAACQLWSSAWPHAVATVRQAGWDGELSMTHRGGSEYSVRYDYQVDGKTYNGTRINFGGSRSVMYVLNAHEERQPREEDQVYVSYAPFLPALCVLLPGPGPALWIWGVGAVLVAVMFWMFARLLREPVI